MADSKPTGAVRIDRWLWAARVYKSRSLAAQACDGGKVRVNDIAAKPHKLVRPDDLVEVSLERGRRQLRVRGLSERRGPAPAARELYEDLTPLPAPRETEPPLVRREPGSGRPTKRDRRETDRWRGR